MDFTRCLTKGMCAGGRVFPTPVRASTLAVSMNIGRLVTATRPFVSSPLVARLGANLGLAAVIVASTLLVSFAALCFLPSRPRSGVPATAAAGAGYAGGDAA